MDEWISVTDRLPDYSDYFRIRYRARVKGRFTVGTCVSMSWYDSGNGWQHHSLSITHWMPCVKEAA